MVAKKKYENSATSFVLKKADIDHIYDILKGSKTIKNASEKFQFKKKNYCLNDDQVCRNIDGRVLPVAFMEQFYEIIYDIHAVKRLHQGSIYKFCTIIIIKII